MSEPSILATAHGNALLKRSDRRTLAISVLPDGSLELTAPQSSSETAILEKVAKRSRWILAKRREFETMNATRSPRRFVSGATHRYLGRQYRLKLIDASQPSVRLKGAFFHVAGPTLTQDDVQGLLEAWFRQKARCQFTARLETWRPWTKRHRLPTPSLILRRMSKRWGSAGKNGKITLNPELIHAPSACIDYVITHEICHLKHSDHSPRFFRLLSSLQPDWKARKSRLERHDL